MAGWLARQQLAKQKIPERLELLAALPRNAAGKVSKKELRERYGATDAQAAGTQHGRA